MATKKSQNVATNYRCECCDYSTSKIYDFNKHNNTKKHIVNDKSIKSTNLSQNVANVANITNITNIATNYRCECCDYSTSKIYDFNKHNATKKHIVNDKCRKMSQMSQMSQQIIAANVVTILRLKYVILINIIQQKNILPTINVAKCRKYRKKINLFVKTVIKLIKTNLDYGDTKRNAVLKILLK